ncbi:M23 family metallopeptidase [Parvularcula sp. LCG005]|uniref:M23 family metallopeptidase n=1 Tax=Parvularcula sp. LCG005 TaxID=3078805 RepID=UPI00294281D8|nr:M23 family metallopeptidase [Parvularcula sp. LCG005]WOI54730.1 M23 family metallopeptidase [Parvularcula sp. LCG005]
MTRFSLMMVSALSVSACAAFAQPPVPSVSPTKKPAGNTVTSTPVAEEPQVEIVQDLANTKPAVPFETVLDGNLVQGGLVFGSTAPGTKVRLKSGDVTKTVAVDEAGNFVFGFDRDHGPTAVLVVTSPDGSSDSRELKIAPTAWKESVITVEESKANPYKKEDLDKIAADTALKNDARSRRADEALWTVGFEWPEQEGCISSPFGYRRIVNGTPRRFHSGVDVAAPDGMSPLDYVGTPVYAPADGYVRLANPDMFFEGGLVFIDHGQELETALMHMSKVDVKSGAFIRKGDKVGEVGSTGRVTGPHLHWSLKWQDRLVDPELVVDERPVCTD